MTQSDVREALEKQNKAILAGIERQAKVQEAAKAEQERLRDEREHKPR